MTNIEYSGTGERFQGKTLAVYTSAKFGVEYVAQNIVNKISENGVEVTYHTTPSNSVPNTVTGNTLTPGWTETAINHVHDTALYRPTVLLLRNILFWRSAFQHASRNHDAYDAIWFNGPHPLAWGWNDEVTASSLIAEKSLVTLHGPVYVGEQRQSLDSAYYKFREYAHERALKRCQSNISVVGPHIFDQVTSLDPPTEVTLIGNGVDTSTFRPDLNTDSITEKIDQPDSDTTFLSLGRLTEQKRPFRMIDVYERMSEDTDSSTLLVAGTGEKKRELEEYVDENNVNHVEFLGYVSEDIKRQLYAYADVFLQMSKYEGGYPPLTIAEAMSAETAIVASDIRDFEVVNTADCGILLNPEDVKKFDRFVGFFDNIQKYQRKSREYAVEELDWGERYRKYLHLLFKTQ